MRNLILCLFLLVEFFGNAHAYPAWDGTESDTSRVKENIRFASYLINLSRYDEALLLLQDQPLISTIQIEDSIKYLKGWAYYSLGILDSSATYLGSVSHQSPTYMKSRFFTACDLFHLQRFDEGSSILDGIADSIPTIRELKEFELSGAALIKRDIQAFQQHSVNFSYNWYPIAEEERKLEELCREQLDFHPKSMALAGIMSAILPGSGKIYAGKTGEGISAFLTVSILGSVAAENLIKNGIADYRTILFGSAFSVFYIGNIYGSMIDIKVYREEFYKQNENSILFNIHIPLSNIFNLAL